MLPRFDDIARADGGFFSVDVERFRTSAAGLRFRSGVETG